MTADRGPVYAITHERHDPQAPLSFPALWNMNFGFLGIQFGWGLQMANMSPIYKYLGAADAQIARLWLAAPLTRPHRAAARRRDERPHVGTARASSRPIFWSARSSAPSRSCSCRTPGSLAEALLPHWPKFYMAALLLWVLDASINVSMEPFRAFVADKLPEHQRGAGFAMQSFFIGVGAVVAGLLPYILRHGFDVSTEADGANALPTNVKISFYIGAAAFLGAVLWTVSSTKEDPPADLEAFRRAEGRQRRVWPGLARDLDALRNMPGLMRRLAVVQFFTWLGLFCTWLHFSNAVPVLFGSSDPNSDLFKRGAEWAGVCYAVKDGVTFVAAFALMAAAADSPADTFTRFCLTLGGLGLLAVGFFHGEEQKYLLLGALALGGIAWASILSMPYAMLAGRCRRNAWACSWASSISSSSFPKSSRRFSLVTSCKPTCTATWSTPSWPAAGA